MVSSILMIFAKEFLVIIILQNLLGRKKVLFSICAHAFITSCFLGEGIKIEKDMDRKDRGVRDLGNQEKKNAFQNFPQREFDYDTLVLAEINKGFDSVK